MDVNQERVVIDGRDDHYGAMGVGLGALVLLFIFLVIIAWAVRNSHEDLHHTVRDGHNHNNNSTNLLLFQQALKEAAVQNALTDARVQVILNKTESIENSVLASRGDLLTGFAATNGRVEFAGLQNSQRVIDFGVQTGFRNFSLVYPDPCCDRRRDRDDFRGNQSGNSNNDTIFNSGVLTGAALTRTASSANGANAGA